MLRLYDDGKQEVDSFKNGDDHWQDNNGSDIVISNLQLVAPLVFHSSDQVRHQLFFMDLVVHGDFSLAAEQDSLKHSISYSTMAKLIRNYTDTLPMGECVTIFQYMTRISDLIFQTFHAHFSKSESHWLSVKISLPKYSLTAEQVGLEWKCNNSGTLNLGSLFINSLECMAKIGINDWERVVLQKLSITTWLKLPLTLFTQVMQYPVTMLITALSNLVSTTQYLTVEAVSECIAQFLYYDYGFSKLNLFVEKLNAIPSAASAGIRLTRSIAAPRPETSTTVYLALGSNMGDRLVHIQQALGLLSACTAIYHMETSMMYEAKPMYYLEQNLFLNCVCKVSTSLSLEDMLDVTQKVETQMGRTKLIDKGPRNIDIDILFYADHVIQTDRMTVPHPGLCEREFVLRPLTDIAACFIHPYYHVPIKDLLSLLLKKSAQIMPSNLPWKEFPYVDLWPVLTLRGRTINWKSRETPTRVMGILNVTPDSFSDGGLYNKSVEIAVQRAIEMIQEGADIIDIGGASTRPGSGDISSQEEMDRVIPVIQSLRRLRPDIPISIDTWRSEVALKALNSGADIINDISGGRLDPCILNLAAERKVPIILMHSKGNPKTMMSLTESYEHAQSHLVVQDIAHDMQRTIEEAAKAGIYRWNIILDPGIGFAKAKDQNLALLRCFSRYEPFSSFPVLIGPSRKQFIQDCNAIPVSLSSSLSPPFQHERIWGTAAAVSAAVTGGALIVRVHDVKEMKAVAMLADSIWKSTF